jgi:copper chaperone CopZ
VKKALESETGVVEATADYRAGAATLRARGPVDEALLRQTVEAEDYPVKSIRRL